MTCYFPNDATQHDEHRLCLIAFGLGKWHFVTTVRRCAPDHPWCIRLSYGGKRGYGSKFFQVGWNRKPDYCGRKWPIAIRFHCGGIGSLLWCTHRA